jgi:hypothetical protein
VISDDDDDDLFRAPREDICITLTCVLPSWWGAIDAWREEGAEGVRTLLEEDLPAFLSDCNWKVERLVNGRPITTVSLKKRSIEDQ